MKQKVITSLLIMTMTLAGAGGMFVSAAELPDPVYVTAEEAAEEAATAEEAKAAEDEETMKDEKTAEEKKAVTEEVTGAEEKADEAQQTPKVKVAENGQTKYENVYALGKDRVVMDNIPPLY